MRIAVSTNSPGKDSQLEPRFGRAAGFVIYDSDTTEYRFVDNSVNSQLSQGAGIQTAQLLADQGVSVVISGRFGPKAAPALESGGIRMIESGGGTVQELVENYVSGAAGTASSGIPSGSGTSVAPVAGPGCRRMGGSGRGMGMGGGRGMGGGGRGMGGGRRQN